MNSAKLTTHAQLNPRVRALYPLLLDTSALRRVALQYASKQLTHLLLSSSLRRRWALGPDKTIRVLDYITRVDFTDAAVTAEVNFLRECEARIAPQFFLNFIVVIEDLLGVLLHERNHYLLVGLIYPMVLTAFDPRLPHNLIDDILINALVRSLCFTDVFERFYLGANGDVKHKVPTDACGNWTPPPDPQQFTPWSLPLLTYRNDYAVQGVTQIIIQASKHKALTNRLLGTLYRMLAVHWCSYTTFRRRLVDLCGSLHKDERRHPLAKRLRRMLREAEGTTCPAGLTVKQWAEMRVQAEERYTLVDCLNHLRQGFMAVQELQRRMQRTRGSDKKPLPVESPLPLLGQSQPEPLGAVKVTMRGDDDQCLPEWTDADTEMARVAREGLEELQICATRTGVTAINVEPLDRYQRLLVDTLAGHIAMQYHDGEQWHAQRLPTVPAHLTNADLCAIAHDVPLLDFGTRIYDTSVPNYHLIVDVSGSMSRFLPLLPPFLRAIRPYLDDTTVNFSGVCRELATDEAAHRVLTNHSTKFIPVWELVLQNDWQRIIVLTDDYSNEGKDALVHDSFLQLQHRIRQNVVVLCLIRVSDNDGPWTELLRWQGQLLGSPHALVILDPDAVRERKVMHGIS
jgi:hypothetical protein